jgi:serine O-acetyltransferase
VAANPIETFLADLRAPVERDPAARGYLDVLISYPGLRALTAHRAIHVLYRLKVPLVPRFLASVSRFLTGIEIDPGATIGKGVFIDHGMGVVIGETAEVGDGCTIYQGVTLGGTSLQRSKRHPTLGRDVTVGSGAAILGAIYVGDGARIGANSVVVKDVPANATVAGGDRRPRVDLPDPNAPLIDELAGRIAALEARLAELERQNASSPL